MTTSSNQSRVRDNGGERDIVKKVLELPLPKFNSIDDLHNEMVQFALEATAKVKSILPELEGRYDSIGKIRSLVKEVIKGEILGIDSIVRVLLLKQGSNS